jgi:hypothetical protein
MGLESKKLVVDNGIASYYHMMVVFMQSVKIFMKQWKKGAKLWKCAN